MNRRKVLAAGMTLCVVGCLRRDDPTSPSDLITEALDRRARLETLSATRDVTIETDSGTMERTERVRRRPPAATRREVLESTDPTGPEGAVVVRNRTTRWDYDPVMESVSKRYHPNRIVADRARLVLEGLLADYELALEGTDEIDGRTAHRVVAEPTVEEVMGASINVAVGGDEFVFPLHGLSGDDLEAAEVTRTLWIDDDERHPIGERDVVTVGDEVRHRLTFTFTDLALDEGLPSGTFRFDPPEDAEVRTRGTEPSGIFGTIEEAETATPYPLPRPEVPEPQELDRVTVVEPSEDVTTATLWYVHPERSERELYVEVRDRKRFNEDVLEAETIDGRTAYRRDGRIDSLFWTCGGLSYEASSPSGDHPLAEIAASIEC